jgi:hypothetical protein
VDWITTPAQVIVLTPAQTPGPPVSIEKNCAGVAVQPPTPVGLFAWKVKSKFALSQTTENDEKTAVVASYVSDPDVGSGTEAAMRTHTP